MIERNDDWAQVEATVPVGKDEDVGVLKSKAKALDTLLEALATACGKTLDDEQEPVTEALLDKVRELQETRKRLFRAEAIVFEAERSPSRRLSAMARAYQRDYPVDPGPPLAPASEGG